jgi:ubiquinol-cytochrome c reductase iron-sulfur subunit
MSSLLRSGVITTATKTVAGSPASAFIAVKSTAEVKCDGRQLSLNDIAKELRENPKSLLGPSVKNRVFGGHTQYRLYHTDVKFPDFTDYRKDATKDPTARQIDTEDDRKLATYLTYGVGGIIGMYVGKATVRKIVAFKGPAADTLAMANTEVDLSKIAEGTGMTATWRGKPVFVRHRTADEIAKEASVNVAELRDPQHDHERVKNPEWLVCIGVCTHLGCVPIAGQGDFGGYYCPCHGSHYDASGRIRKGPAPLNLEVPAYSFANENTLVIGSSD